MKSEPPNDLTSGMMWLIKGSVLIFLLGTGEGEGTAFEVTLHCGSSGSPSEDGTSEFHSGSVLIVMVV